MAVTENVACICTCSIRPRRSSAAFSMSFDSCVYWDAPKKILSRSDNASLIDSWLSGGWLSHIDAGIPASRTQSVQKLPRRGIFIYGANFWSATPKDTGLSNETIPRGVALRIREGQVNLYQTPFFYGHYIYKRNLAESIPRRIQAVLENGGNTTKY